MENVTASSLTLILILGSITNTIAADTTTTHKRLVLKLLHHNSSRPTYFNEKDTILDHAKRTIEGSISRFAYLSEKVIREDEIEASLVPSFTLPLFYVSFSIGSKPVPQLAVMDTGSSLLWVKCLPCRPCSSGSGQTFDPSKSSTYEPFPCDVFNCRRCNLMNQCLYNVTYIKGPSSLGVLATEQLTFDTSDGGKSVISKVLFGCGHENGNSEDQNFSGVFGLGAGIGSSLIYQLGSKFSYCVGDIKDPNYDYSRLFLGSSASVDGYSTPFTILYGHYYLKLEGISIGTERLDIDASSFQKTISSDNGVIIDSGAGLTFLARRPFAILSAKIQELLDGILARIWTPRLPLCYGGDVEQDLRGFPAITFHFKDGADLVLDTGSSFLQVNPYMFCTAIVPSDANEKKHENLSLLTLVSRNRTTDPIMAANASPCHRMDAIASLKRVCENENPQKVQGTALMIPLTACLEQKHKPGPVRKQKVWNSTRNHRHWLPSDKKSCES